MSHLWSLLQPVSPQTSQGANQSAKALRSLSSPLSNADPASLSEKPRDDTFVPEPQLPGAWQWMPHIAPNESLARPRSPSIATSTGAANPADKGLSAQPQDADLKTSNIDPKFVSWLSSLHALPQAVRGATSFLASAAMGAAAVGVPFSSRSETWRAREEQMVQSAWQLEQTLPLTAKVGLVRTMKAGALSSGAYSLVLPWVIFTYPVLGLFTPVIVGILFGVSVGLGAFAQEWSRKLAVRHDRKDALPRYDKNLRQLVYLQQELKELKVGRPLSTREHLERKAAATQQAELTALSVKRPLSPYENKMLKDAVEKVREIDEIQKGRELDLRETHQLKQLNALRLRYEGGFRNLLRQAFEAVIDGYAVPELHLGSNA